MATSQASVASSQPDKRHIRLIAASAQANEAKVHDLLAEDPPWTSATDLDALRQSLQKVAARGKLSIVRLLLQHGAEVNAKRDNETPALIKAAESGNVAVVEELLAHHADANIRTRAGQTALFAACVKGHNKVIATLLNGGADVDGTDKEGRSPLLFLAADKQTKAKWTIETLKILRDRGADLEVRDDQTRRTPLLWAATNGNVGLTRFLLESHANVAATNKRDRTALHLAAESNHEEVVRLLLAHGANPQATSDGGWTPLHNAAQCGFLPIVALLLGSDVDVNAALTNGMTPMHWAAFNGFEDIVRLLLTRPDVNLGAKDTFDRTPMLCAAEKHHGGIVKLLSPARVADRLSPMERRACEAFEATVVDFGQFEKKQLVSKHSVYELLYGWNEDSDKPKVSTLTKNLHYKPDFRWIHLPANNIAWAETLLAKSFIEAGHRDIESFKALEKCFDQEHRGQFAHAHFMRTFCHRISSVRGDEPESKKDDTPLVTLSEEHSEISTKSSIQSGGDALTPRTPNEVSDGGTPTKPESKKKSKAGQFAENHPRRTKRAKGFPGNPPKRQESTASSASGKLGPLPWDTARYAASNGKIVLFMPFLHYETDERRQKMSTVIKKVREEKRLVENNSRDSLLINAYITNNPPLHPRRTLDQFFYHGIDTTERDVDQVVYRYCKRHSIERKVFMVDQLWLWVIGKDLVITCFPQRWDQPKNDPLNVLDGIIEETNAKTRPPISSVYDLAMLITSRCSAMFNHSRLSDQNYQFLDMFEHSIGVITDRESRLFRRFNTASAQSAQWLERHRRRRVGRMTPVGPSLESSSHHEGRDGEDEDDGAGYPDALLDIGDETSLLAEIKDIRDELNIIMAIIEAQVQTVNHFEGLVTEELRGEGTKRATDTMVSEIRRRAGEQKRNLEARQKDIGRMDSQALSLYHSLTDLLDLKQKHSNALEARFAGDQAVIAAKQGQTIMVFTIVTIIFLPLSFIAAFFAINLQEWQQTTPLTIPYVSKYMFGIGLGISIPLVALAFTVDDISQAAINLYSQIKGTFSRTQRNTARSNKKRRSSRQDAVSRGSGYGEDEHNDPDLIGGVVTQEKIDVSKPSFSSHQPNRHLSVSVNGNQYPSHNNLGAFERPPMGSRDRSDEHYNYNQHGRLSPVAAIGGHGHRRGPSMGSAAGNSGRWVTRPSLERSSGSRARGLGQTDLERGQF
ncbi:hypothetical protein F5Y16DRAFT_383366 [Xylariaceae sp. FL0255]|nr:hypothetical protein F5Y16DRAFT_383366 [Xylariaceae sp. FL0255]